MLTGEHTYFSQKHNFSQIGAKWHQYVPLGDKYFVVKFGLIWQIVASINEQLCATLRKMQLGIKYFLHQLSTLFDTIKHILPFLIST